ncbi:alpha/beta hydrolase [Dolichospermum sp. ST_con]|nr:alpha/beta hydrolase [Dolichospermum sp. ST_con]MDD1417828.1 alpha/beta hydrolase [Dolichospermum sp. ST_sed1]MDD1423086.1 alpha/beta hydrolase [Dolichospermum sp. ST_sed9]MDD1430521.1 alpha/beta hydrolase [Dolichospermum sp. ST_sed6]MDD1436035.1 alpha/beta hydrolase [Dolichospermum sp. ST_sed10]MDD1442997.1 alpha/beta hydrolase [Dolichospermum sp. ST_sed3]MDD1444762.1 alpha/beta hydrolase [Dolichospermum sp. ST_sed8]MDD1456979.1 alpha/beta hydrolase [Dolichospermum sp. ST_sed7]MDD146204
MPVRQTLLTSDIQLSYLEWNQGQEPLLLLHGMADHALVWSSLGDYLAADYHIVAPDMRGHGESSKPEKDYTFTSAISDLEALMDKLGWSTAHIVSHSWTGKLAAIWARENPTRLKSITLVDPIFIWKMPSFLKIAFPLLYRVLPFLKSMGPFASYEEAEQKIKQLSQYQNWSPLQQQVFQAAIEQKADGTWGSKFTIAARDGIFDAVMEVPGFIHSVDTPALFIQPEKGVNRQNWQIQPYKTNLKNLNLCQVPGNHWPFLTNPTEFNQTVAAFLATQT